jgi:hypothetical protein
MQPADAIAAQSTIRECTARACHIRMSSADRHKTCTSCRERARLAYRRKQKKNEGSSVKPRGDYNTISSCDGMVCEEAASWEAAMQRVEAEHFVNGHNMHQPDGGGGKSGVTKYKRTMRFVCACRGDRDESLSVRVRTHVHCTRPRARRAALGSRHAVRNASSISRDRSLIAFA